MLTSMSFSSRLTKGFTLIEMLVVTVILLVTATIAFPAYNKVVVRARVKETASALRDDLRIAQSDALSRRRTVALVLSNNTPVVGTSFAVTSALAAAGNKVRNWGVFVLPITGVAGSDTQLLRSMVPSTTSKVHITLATTTGSATSAVCFGSEGRLVDRSTGSTAGNTTCASAGVSFDIIDSTGSTNTTLRVQIAASGKARLCDPSIPTGSPGGC